MFLYTSLRLWKAQHTTRHALLGNLSYVELACPHCLLLINRLRLSDGLKTSLVIPAFELKSRLEVNSSHDSDQRSRKTSTILKSDCYGEPITEHAAPMRDSEVRGNRPVLFYYNKVGETGAEACIGAHKDDQYGIATTNRAFCYNHIAGKVCLNH